MKQTRRQSGSHSERNWLCLFAAEILTILTLGWLSFDTTGQFLKRLFILVLIVALPFSIQASTMDSAKVAAESDDAYWYTGLSGGMDTANNNCYIGHTSGGKEVFSAFRFLGIDVPQGATVDSAFLIITQRAATDSTRTIYFSLHCEDTANALTLVVDSADFIARHVTTDSTIDTIIAPTQNVQYSSIITAAVQEVINRADWDSTNAMLVKVKGFLSSVPTGSNDTYFTGYTFHSDVAKAAILKVFWSPAGAPPASGKRVLIRK